MLKITIKSIISDETFTGGCGKSVLLLVFVFELSDRLSLLLSYVPNLGLVHSLLKFARFYFTEVKSVPSWRSEFLVEAEGVYGQLRFAVRDCGRKVISDDEGLS
jgi:hypothetical protein